MGPDSVTLAAFRLHLIFQQEQMHDLNTFGVIGTNMPPHSSSFAF